MAQRTETLPRPIVDSERLFLAVATGDGDRIATFIDDPLGVKHRHRVGVENMMWSSDHPHTVSTWPHSQEIIARDFVRVPEDEKRKIVRANVIGLYNLDLAA